MSALEIAELVGKNTLVVLVLLGALPLTAAVYQYLLVGLHARRNHYDEVAPTFPNTAILIPAWNEDAVIAASIDRLIQLEYPADRLRIYVVDDGSTDRTPDVVLAKAAEFPGRVFHLRRENGGQGKAHTLNHGLDIILSEDWMEALLIMDADVIYARDSLRKMTRHLADPTVGAVTAYIMEGSEPGGYMTRFIAYEYITAQAGARRSQNVLGAMACLAGGAQLHSRENLEALGSRIDTSSLAEDTFTTINTQLGGRKCVFEGNAIVKAEEPDGIVGLWKQRLRWARGNVQVSLRYKSLWFRPNGEHRLGSISFGVFWFTIFLLPVFMILSSASLVVLFFVDFPLSWETFKKLWIINAISFIFITSYCLMIDTETAKRAWKEAVIFPGVISVLIILYTVFPRLFGAVANGALDLLDINTPLVVKSIIFFAYVWVAACMGVAYLGKFFEAHGLPRLLSRLMVYLGGYGPLLCAVTFASYGYELRGAEMTWDKTVKTGKVAA